VSSPKIRCFPFDQEKASSLKETDLRGMFLWASKSACTSAIMALPDPLSDTPSTFSGMKTPENTEQDPDDPSRQQRYPNGIPF